jgi:hypothetical protein
MTDRTLSRTSSGVNHQRGSPERRRYDALLLQAALPQACTDAPLPQSRYIDRLMPLPSPPTLSTSQASAAAATTARLQARWIAGFTLVGALLLGAGAWQHHMDRQDPRNDQPVAAEMVSAKLSGSDKGFFVVGTARYSLGGRSYESVVVDNKDYVSAAAAATRLQEFGLPRRLTLYCLRRPDANDPCALSQRLNLRVETTWAFFSVLLGGALLFAGGCIWPVNTYGGWAATRAPGWLRELGFMPLYLLLVPVVTGMLFLFEWYWGF